MKTIFQNIILLSFILSLLTSCGGEEVKVNKQPINYIVLLDLK
jgi:hypothetical protein